MTIAVLVAVTGPWEAPLAAGLERSDLEITVVRRCADLAEVLSAAAAGLARAAILSWDLPHLDRQSVWDLLEAGVAVVGLTDPSDGPAAGASAGRLARLGVQRTLPADTPATEVAMAAVDAVRELESSPAARGGRHLGPPPVAAEADQPGPPSGAGAGVPPSTGGQGRLVAVWGPAGAPGRTTVALNLAGELAARGEPTLLVDADTYAASIAQCLALLDESAGLAAAVRAANQGVLDAERLAVLAPLAFPGLRVLTGLPRPQRWPELRPSGLSVVWDRAREIAAWTVVDCAFCLETDEELSFDTSAPRRNGATLSALTAADVVLAVGSADPVGLQRLVRGLMDLREVLPPGVSPRVVVTRVRSSAVGAFPQQRIADALGRYAGVSDVLGVPDDPAAHDAAMLAGRTLSECEPGSPARWALAELAAELCGAAEVRSPRGVLGRRRRPVPGPPKLLRRAP